MKVSSNIWKKSPKVAIVGTPNDIINEIKKYMVVGGVRYFTIHFPDLPDLKLLFAKSVIPYFRNSSNKKKEHCGHIRSNRCNNQK